MKRKIANVFDITADKHDCRINWYGASRAVEATVVLELCIDLYDSDYDIFIDKIISNDYSTMRSHLVHKDKGGKLPPPPLPKFLDNHNHQIMLMSGPIFALAKSEGKNPVKCKKINAL